MNQTLMNEEQPTVKCSPLGIGTHVTVIDYDNATKIKLSGYSLNSAFAFNNWRSLKAVGICKKLEILK